MHIIWPDGDLTGLVRSRNEENPFDAAIPRVGIESQEGNPYMFLQCYVIKSDFFSEIETTRISSSIPNVFRLKVCKI